MRPVQVCSVTWHGSKTHQQLWEWEIPILPSPEPVPTPHPHLHPQEPKSSSCCPEGLKLQPVSVPGSNEVLLCPEPGDQEGQETWASLAGTWGGVHGKQPLTDSRVCGPGWCARV